MTILTVDQRQEILDKVGLLEVTLETYSSAAFQASLTQNVTDAQNVDDGIKALYDKIDTNIIRAYERERLALDGRFVRFNISDFYTGESDEIQALGELSDNYIENIITPAIIAISEANSPTPPSNVQVDPDNDIFRSNGNLDPIPANARRMFPQSGTDIRRITEFNKTATLITMPVNAGSFNNIEINNTEEFLLQYETNATAGGSTVTTGGSTFLEQSIGSSIGTITGAIRVSQFTPPSVTEPATANSVTLAVGNRFSVNNTLWQVIVAGSGTGAVLAGMGGMGTPASPGTCTVIALSSPNTCSGLGSNTNQNTTSQVNVIRAGQLPVLALELAQLNLNQDQTTNTNSSAITDINNRTAFLSTGTGTSLTDRITEVSDRITEINTRIGSTSTILNTNYDMRYEFANQRANFANGTIGGITSAIATRDTFLLPNGSEILSLQEEIQALNDSITFSDGFTS